MHLNLQTMYKVIYLDMFGLTIMGIAMIFATDVQKGRFSRY